MGKSNRVVNIESKNVLAKLMATENIHVEHKKVSTASFDVKNRRLILPIWKDMDDTMYEGLIGHEVGHALWTPYEEWAEFAKKNSHLKAYANILEDARIERKMKIKYPGMKKTFFGMYDKLAREDFFGTNGRDLDEYGLADRLNLSFKIGALAEVPFSEEENEFRERVLKAETFEEILDLATELGEIASSEAETNMEDMAMSDYGDEAESNEDEDVEPSGSSPFPMPTPPESEENEEEEDSGARADSDEEKEEGNNEGNCESDEADGEGEKKESEIGDEGDENSDESNHAASGNCDAEMTEEEANDSDVPEPETTRAWDNAMKQLNDELAKEPVYLDLPKINPYKAVVPWKATFDQLNEHWSKDENFSSYRYHYEDVGGDKWKKDEENEFRTWKKDTNQIVNYMVKEFEMKQAATEYRRTSISKTGVLDMNKLHKYRTDEDIFRRVAAVKDGRNHALLMFIDWSGSMHGKMEATVKQTLTLVMFARKVGIPYRVYSFSNSGGILERIGKETYYTRMENTSVDHLIPGKLGMHEYFSEKMSSREFNIQLKNMAFLGKSIDYSGLSHPPGHGTCSTPLNESILAATEMVGDFKKETGAEKINAIFLTDGGADYCSDYWDSEKQEKKDVYSHSSYRDSGKYLVIRDNVTKRLIHTDGSRANLTGNLLRNLGNRHNINVIGFHITDNKRINQQIHREASYTEHADLKNFCRKNGYVPMKESGYATYFLVNDRQLDQEAKFDTNGTTDDAGNVAKGKLRTQFRKFTSARKVNKMMLNEFVALVA